VAISSAKQRALLALLALNAGQVVSADRLIDGVWGEVAGADALNALQHHVSRLRKLGAPLLLTRPTGYVLDVPPTDVDALQFGELVRQARAALRQGDAAKARAAFSTAFPLWRGTPLVEFADHDWARQEQARLEELYLSALEDRIDADLAAGAGVDLLDELRRLVVEQPFRERLWGQLMVALYRSGRQTEALAAYQEARGVLAEEHGVDPGPELVRLEAAILAHDPGLTVHSRTKAPDPPVAQPVVPPGSGRRRGLPASLTSFIGRHEQLPALRALLAQARLITLTGPPGVGKTRLAIELGRAAQGDFDDRVWLLELARLSNAPVMIETLAALVGVTQVSRDASVEALEHVVDHLRGQRGLLILDNCEHLLADVSGMVGSLLAGCPELQVLATSREPLGIPGEAQRPVAPLSLAAPGTRAPRELLGSEAVRLFEDRAVSVRPDFALTADTASSVDEICRRLDGLPLAIELAAARVKVLPADHIAQALRDRFRFLVAGSRAAPERQQTLRAAIDWSYDLLDENEQRVFEELSVFTGGCSLASAQTVGEQIDLRGFDMLDVLARLVDKSMLVATTGAAGHPRYHLLETLRAYGIERLVEHGRLDAARQRHAELFVSLAEETEGALRGPQRTAYLRLLNDELDNVRAVLQNALDSDDGAVALQVASALGFFFSTTNRVGEGRHWLQAVIARADASASDIALARAHTYLGPMLIQHGEFDGAVAAAERGLEYAAAAHDSWQTAYAKATLALTLDAAGRSERASDLLAQARAEFARIAGPRGDWGVAQCEFVIGLAAVRSANIDAVDHAALELKIRAGRIQYDLFEGWSCLMAGWVAERRGDAARAEQEYQRVVELTRALGIGGHVAFAIANLGRLLANVGQLERARFLHSQTNVLIEDGAAPWFAAYAHVTLATTMIRLGDADSAEELLRQAIAECPESGSRHSQERFFSLFGGSPAARAQIALSILLRMRGLTTEADRLLLAGLDTAERDGDAECIARGFEAWAIAAVNAADMQRGATLLGASEGVRERIHAPRDRFDDALIREVMAQLDSTLGTPELARLVSAGSALSTQDALRLARGSAVLASI
jgi:predicted ATPase